MIEREIGSEFHYLSLDEEFLRQNLLNLSEQIFVFCGRTAIETVLANLPHIKKALLPSYCCESMIQPFENKNIAVEFYDVYYDNGIKVDLVSLKDIDLILWCNYFGFKLDMPDFSEFIQDGGIIVEDITHSLLSSCAYNTQSQFVVASLRKWFPILSGGFCASIKGNSLKYRPDMEVPKEFLDLKKSAMLDKAVYLKNQDSDLKAKFLRNFSLSNDWLSKNYSMLKIDDESIEILKKINLEELKEHRCKNAEVIYKYLNEINIAEPLFKKDNMECPLFVPIIFRSKKERDFVRQKLIESSIYCPIHWTKPNCECISNLYDLELSLICDQRYEESDIERMMKIICDLS